MGRVVACSFSLDITLAYRGLGKSSLGVVLVSIRSQNWIWLRIMESLLPKGNEFYKNIEAQNR